MKNRSVLLSLLVIIFLETIAGCSGDNKNPIMPEEPKGKLSAINSSMDFGTATDTLSVVIKNIGEGKLNWHVESTVSWLAISPMSGAIQSGDSTNIISTVVRSSLSTGQYSGSFKIESDGGSATVNVSVEILPPLIAKWTLVEGRYNGNLISNLTATIEFKDDTEYSARFEAGSNKGSASAQYTIENDMLKTNLPSSILLNGISFGSTGGIITWRTNISCSRTPFRQYGGAAIGWSANNDLKISIVDKSLIISSSDGLTVLKYRK